MCLEKHSTPVSTTLSICCAFLTVTTTTLLSEIISIASPLPYTKYLRQIDTFCQAITKVPNAQMHGLQETVGQKSRQQYIFAMALSTKVLQLRWEKVVILLWFDSNDFQINVCIFTVNMSKVKVFVVDHFQRSASTAVFANSECHKYSQKFCLQLFYFTSTVSISLYIFAVADINVSNHTIRHNQHNQTQWHKVNDFDFYYQNPSTSWILGPSLQGLISSVIDSIINQM